VPATVGVTIWLPLVAWLPVHEPLAAQLVALVLDHVSVELCPVVMLAGSTDRLTVGDGVGAVTVSVAAPVPVPPGPVQLKV
jgi:hypothetical protein